MEPIEIADLDLKPLFGATFTSLSADDVVRRFGALAADPSFYLTALADIAPQDEAVIRTYISEERRVAAWAVHTGPAHLRGTILFASTITRATRRPSCLPAPSRASRWSTRGAPRGIKSKPFARAY